jgi:hypothetical protein
VKYYPIIIKYRFALNYNSPDKTRANSQKIDKREEEQTSARSPRQIVKILLLFSTKTIVAFAQS